MFVREHRLPSYWGHGWGSAGSHSERSEVPPGSSAAAVLLHIPTSSAWTRGVQVFHILRACTLILFKIFNLAWGKCLHPGEAASTWAVHRSQSRTSLDLRTLRDSPEGTSQALASRGAEQSAGGVSAGVILCGCHPGRGPRLREGQPQRCSPVLTFLSLQSRNAYAHVRDDSGVSHSPASPCGLHTLGSEVF